MNCGKTNCNFTCHCSAVVHNVTIHDSLKTIKLLMRTYKRLPYPLNTSYRLTEVKSKVSDRSKN